MSDRNIIITASIFCLLAVGFGAFGAHALKETLSNNGYIETYKTAVQYHIFHALGLFITGILQKTEMIKNAKIIASLFLLGILLFSGSLYLLSITGLTWLGMITPIGGLAFIFGWLLLAIEIWRK